MSDDPRVPGEDEKAEPDHVLHAPGISIETTDIGYDRLKGDRRAPPRLRRIDIVVLLLLLLATGLTRFVRLSEPGDVLPASDPACTASPPIGKTCYEPIPTPMNGSASHLLAIASPNIAPAAMRHQRNPR